jgi:hypothetical protein
MTEDELIEKITNINNQIEAQRRAISNAETKESAEWFSRHLRRLIQEKDRLSKILNHQYGDPDDEAEEDDEE